MPNVMAALSNIGGEIRRGKKKKIEETTGQKYNGLSYSIGQPYSNNRLMALCPGLPG